MKRLVDSAHGRGVEILYTVIEALARDGRDRSLDLSKILGRVVRRWPGSSPMLCHGANRSRGRAQVSKLRKDGNRR
jgi:hypothetical protein